MFKSVRHCPQQFDLPESKIRPFEKILMNYESKLLNGVIFQVNFYAGISKTVPYVSLRHIYTL